MPSEKRRCAQGSASRSGVEVLIPSWDFGGGRVGLGSSRTSDGLSGRRMKPLSNALTHILSYFDFAIPKRQILTKLYTKTSHRRSDWISIVSVRVLAPSSSGAGGKLEYILFPLELRP